VGVFHSFEDSTTPLNGSNVSQLCIHNDFSVQTSGYLQVVSPVSFTHSAAVAVTSRTKLTQHTGASCMYSDLRGDSLWCRFVARLMERDTGFHHTESANDSHCSSEVGSF
jgi:hypothetical protein